MSERGAARAGGFTLVEMLVAMGILVFGVTSLVGLLGVGVSTRRTAELKNQAVHAVTQVMQQVRDHLPKQERTEKGDLVPLPPLQIDTIAGYPRLKAHVTFHYDKDHPNLVLARMRISWLEEGIAVGEEFQRVLDTYEALPVRVRRGNEQRP
jgi:prepilin-type N-terminal cleavage/methylation domain-containing protein